MIDDLIFLYFQELVDNEIPIPAEMRSSLMVLHSYVLARQHSRSGDHLKVRIGLKQI